MHTETIFYIILAGIIALSLALFQYLYKSNKPTKVIWLMAFLRFLTIFAVLLVLINPKFEKVTYISDKPKLLIAVDNSESIAYLDQERNTRILVNSLKQNQELDQRFDLAFFSFGKEMQDLDSLSFNEKQTNPALLLDRLSQVYKDVNAPLILITDGNQTYGNDYEFAVQDYQDPIFPVILGDTIKYTDLRIEKLNANRYAYLKNKFPVEIIAVYKGDENISTQLQILSGDIPIFSQKLTFGKDQSSQVIQLNLPADHPGVQSYRAELLPVPNERNTFNNTKNFAVEVIDRKTNVAIISDIVHPDLGALKNAIESNELRQASILKPSEFLNVPEKFQQVILYQPNQTFQLIYEELHRLGLNVFTILGTETDWAEFNKLQPYVQQNITNQQEDFQATLNSNYNVFIVEDLDFSNLPPLQTEFGDTEYTIPYETVLFKTVNGIRIDEPLLLTYEVDGRRAAILNGEGIWRWRAQNYLNEKSFYDFDNFIGKIIQYLDTNQKRSRLDVSYDSFYNGNDNIIISAQFFNKNYEFDNTANIEILIVNQENGQAQTIPFILRRTNYQVDLGGLEAGDYKFTVNVQNATQSKSGEFKILDYNVEQQFMNANVSKLQNLASNSNGTCFFIDNTSEMVKLLLADERFVTIQKGTRKSVPLIDWKFLLALIVLTLSLEWFIRKYHGLI